MGYGDGKYFVKLFTREVGLSPREYRGGIHMKNSLLRWLQWSTSCGKLRSKLLCIYFLLIVIRWGCFPSMPIFA